MTVQERRRRRLQQQHRQSGSQAGKQAEQRCFAGRRRPSPRNMHSDALRLALVPNLIKRLSYEHRRLSLNVFFSGLCSNRITPQLIAGARKRAPVRPAAGRQRSLSRSLSAARAARCTVRAALTPPSQRWIRAASSSPSPSPSLLPPPQQPSLSLRCRDSHALQPPPPPPLGAASLRGMRRAPARVWEPDQFMISDAAKSGREVGQGRREREEGVTRCAPDPLAERLDE